MININIIENNIKDLKYKYDEIKNELDLLKESIVDNNKNNVQPLKELELKIDNIILKKKNEYLESQINYIINNINIDSNNTNLNSIKIGNWNIKDEDNKLYFYNNGLKIARLSSDYDRFQVYRNMNGDTPYFFYNKNGDYGEYKG